MFFGESIQLGLHAVLDQFKCVQARTELTVKSFLLFYHFDFNVTESGVKISYQTLNEIWSTKKMITKFKTTMPAEIKTKIPFQHSFEIDLVRIWSVELDG